MSPRVMEASPLEMEILGILDGQSPMSVSDIQSSLSRAQRRLAYTTVMTLLVRLHRKGLLTRVKQGRHYLYSPANGAENTVRRLFHRVRASLFGSQRLKPILALLDSDESLTESELRELRQAVDDKLKTMRKSK